MTILLKQSTAVILKLGPFVDDADAVTPETGLSIAQGDIQVSKNGGAFAQTSASSPTTTHDADGWYPVPLTATDTATLGALVVQLAMSGALPVWAHCVVVTANVWDTLFSTDKLQVDVTLIEGSDASDTLAGLDDATLAAVAALNDLSSAEVNAEVDTALADYDAPTKAELDSGLGALNDPTAAAIADAVWEEQIGDHSGTGGSTAEALDASGGGVTAAEIADAVWEEAVGDHDGTGGSTAEALSNAGAAGTPPTVEEIADQVWDEAKAGHAAAGSFGEEVQAHALSTEISALNDLSAAEVNAEVDTALADYDAPTKAELDAGLAALNDLSAAQVNAEVDTALADYDAPTKAELDSGLGALNDPTAATIADAVWEEAVGDHDGTSGSTAEALAGAAASGVAGPGALQRTVGVTDGSDPIEGARVWVSTDAAGGNVIAGPLVTDSFGIVTLLLDAGTYYTWVRKDGFGPLLGSEMEVS